MKFLLNVKFTLRLLRKSPAVALSAILAAALGIGAASAMFSVADGVLLRPLPFPRAEQLVNVWESNPGRSIPKMVAAPGNYFDWRAQNQVFSAMGAYQQNTFNLGSRDSEPERFVGAICDPGFFAALGVAPAAGRVFTSEEDQPGRDGVVILGYTLWQQRFGADPNVVGRNLDLNGRQRTVIGVMPRGFEYPAQAVMWSPLGLDAETRARRDFHRLRVVARLKDGVTVERARAELQTIAAHLAQAYPDINKDETAVVNSVLDDLVGDIRPALVVLLGAVGAVLLIACANVANLLLAKASGRRREIAIRSSLGAGRGVILRQMLTESMLLAAIGGAAGLLLAWLSFHGLLSLAPANVPRLEQVRLNWRVVELALGLSLATGILFGLAPAWYAARIDVSAMLKEGTRGSTSRSPLRSVLVTGQVAIAVVLLAGSGLLIRSFAEILRVDAGFRPEGLMTMRLAPAPVKYRGHNDLQIQLARGILERVSAVPGVRSAAISTDVPLLGNPIFIMRFEGRPPVTPSQAPLANYFSVTPGFFETMGMRLVRGRGITERDAAGSPLVAVVNQTLADRYFPGQDPIGKRLEIAFSTPPNWREIVGVVADVKTAGLDQDTPVQVYTAYLQLPSFLSGFVSPMTVLARTAQEPGPLGGAIKAAILAVDRAQPVYAVQPMTEVVSQSIAQRRTALILLAFFAASALLLAAIGVYGVMSYMVTQRTGEIGIRMALGARASQVSFQVERQGMTLVAAGLAVGLGGGLALTRYLAPLLFRVHPRDPAVFGGAAAVLIAVSLAACYLPARRASRVDPMAALRCE
ncbi:MAG: ABC transporter permease [Acidobacteriia bacterium]|nr:ABC transporter permease [Terriglobia bacterium]